MMREELVHTEDRDGFTVRLYLCPEDTAIADSFDSDVDDIAELEDKVSRGDYLWFCAKVTASRAGVELGADYLGACMYEGVADFMQPDGYYEGMVHAAIAEARETIARINA